MPWENSGGSMVWVPDSYTAGLSPSAYQNAIGTGIGETYANQRGVLDLAPIFDTMATRAENPSMYVPQGFRDSNDPLNSVITAPMFGNSNLPQYNTQSPQFPAAYQQYRAGFSGAASQNWDTNGNYIGPPVPGMQDAAIAAYGVFGDGSLRGIGLDADSYANSAALAQRQGQLSQGEFPIAFGAGDRAHYFNANPDYSQYSYPGAEDTTGGVINATTGYYRQYLPQPQPIGPVSGWDPATGAPYAAGAGSWGAMPPMQDYSTAGGGGYNTQGLQPSFTGTTNYGYGTPGDTVGMGYGYGFQPQYPTTQFGGDPAAGYVNPTFGTDWADPGLMNLAPNNYSSLNAAGYWGPNGWVPPAAQWGGGPVLPMDAGGSVPNWGVGSPGFVQPAPAGYPYGTGMDFGVNSPGFQQPAPDWSLGDTGFAAPPVTGPRYQYGTGMGFGLPDISQPTSSGGYWGTNGWVPASSDYDTTPAPSAASLNGFSTFGMQPTSGYGYTAPSSYDTGYDTTGYGSFSDFGMGSNTGYQDPVTGAYSDGSDVANMVSSANYSLQVGAAANARAAAENAAWQAASNAQLANMTANTAAFGQNQFDQNLSRMQSAYNPFSTQYQSY